MGASLRAMAAETCRAVSTFTQILTTGHTKRLSSGTPLWYVHVNLTATEPVWALVQLVIPPPRTAGIPVLAHETE